MYFSGSIFCIVIVPKLINHQQYFEENSGKLASHTRNLEMQNSNKLFTIETDIIGEYHNNHSRLFSIKNDINS